MANIPYKIYLSEDEIPKRWVNMKAAMQEKPEPILNPSTFQPSTREER